MKRFCLDSYRKIMLSLISTGREFLSFTMNPVNGVILRLDVDYDLVFAERIAVINKDLGMKATFFVQMDSPFYNCFSKESSRALEAIAKNDQSVALHYYHRDENFDFNRLNKEYEALKLSVPKVERVVSWHNPEVDLAALNKCSHEAGFVSAYADDFFGEGIYISDSNCRNSPDDIAKFVSEVDSPVVQILLHPIIWSVGGNSMEEILEQYVKDRLEKMDSAFSMNSVWTSGAGKRILESYNIFINR